MSNLGRARVQTIPEAQGAEGSPAQRIYAIEQPGPPPAVDGAWSIPTLARAPHRLLFFVGASCVLLAMLWWTLWLFDAARQPALLAQPAMPAGWLHAMLMQYFVFPPFVFGFLLTVFPRWLDQPAIARNLYVPVGVGLFGGQLLTVGGAFGGAGLLVAGAVFAIAGWTVGLALLLRVLWRARGNIGHPALCAVALSLGLVGLGMYLAYLVTGDARCLFVAIKIGTFGLLLPLYVTVTHRMLPFFARSALPGHTGWTRHAWLVVVWVLFLAHLFLESIHGYVWLWPVDGALVALTALWWWRNRPKRASPPLLRILFIAYTWLPLAMMLYATQSAWYAAFGQFVLGRAPAHALFIGFFGGLLVAMVTRVTQGHSGLPLVLGRVAAFAFIAVQGVAVLRVLAEILPGPPILQALAAAAWLVAFVPWVVRSIRVYGAPRADGKAG